MSYASLIVEEFPQDLQLVMLKFGEALEQHLREQMAVRREDFDGLRGEVHAAQQRSEQRLDRVEAILEQLAAAQQRTELRVEELAAAQQRSEQRLDRVEAILEQLAAAQERTEQRIDQLAAAQERTEQRIEQLAAAQERTEQRIEELAAAQERTERELRQLVAVVEKLSEDHQETRRQLGGLTMTVGYQLEDLAYKALPNLLARDHGLHVDGRLKRGYITDNRGKVQEINILGKARRNGDEVTIVGESKAQLSKNDVDRFLKRRLEPLAGIVDNPFPVLVTYMTSEPDVEAHARAQNVALYYSYDF